MLADLFINNKLEYLFIDTESDKKIVADMTINNNLVNLRYINVFTLYKRATICLDISNEYPDHLLVYNIKYKNK